MEIKMLLFGAFKTFYIHLNPKQFCYRDCQIYILNRLHYRQLTAIHTFCFGELCGKKVRVVMGCQWAVHHATHHETHCVMY